jgi:hypothetical protein
MQDPIGKLFFQIKQKRAAGIAQVTEHLSTKSTTLSSNPCSAKKKNKIKEGGL